ncbi:SigE family RNA polymerase sigma factor [Kribbella deserti]|uniref:SigE family RNA polymerase sigma factor n=1 Tax=Kribbella deserti TaxID=1926257 RepID=A0ABV6QPC1_9ACTN
MRERNTAGRDPGDDFDAFVRARWTTTARFAYALTLDRQAAEDLAQESFAKLWFHWQKVGAENPDGYLRRIVTTTFLSGRRRRWIGERPTAAVPDHPVGPETGRIDDQLSLRQAMGRLSPRQRAAVYLRYAEDLPEQVVAELIGCSVGTVKTHASRGLAALRGDQTLESAGVFAGIAEGHA